MAHTISFFVLNALHAMLVVQDIILVGISIIVLARAAPRARQTCGEGPWKTKNWLP